MSATEEALSAQRALVRAAFSACGGQDHVLAWALEHDPSVAVRLAIALAPWWWVRGRWAAGYDLLAAAVGRDCQGGEQWCTAQFWLGCLAGPLATGQREAGRGHLTILRSVEPLG